MNKTSVFVKFSIYGDGFEPENITKLINITPTDTRVKGILEKDKIRPNIETSWSIRTEEEESYDINIQLQKLIDLLMDKKEIIKKLKNDYSTIDIAFMIVIYIRDNDKPGMYFEANTVKFIADIGGEITFDIYIC